MGGTAYIDLEIYGFPEPRALTLLKVVDSVDVTSSPRHSVKYTAREAPLGLVSVTIFDVIEADFTNYTLTADNGEGEALTYSFYLYEGETSLYVSVCRDELHQLHTHIGQCRRRGCRLLVLPDYDRVSFIRKDFYLDFCYAALSATQT